MSEVLRNAGSGGSDPDTESAERAASSDTEEFTVERLERLYHRAREHGYVDALFGEEGSSPGPYVLWRHDVDLELPAAVAMAELEARNGIRSTFFLMSRSWFYNVFSHEGARAVGRIASLGHRLGLHCDLGVGRDAAVEAAHASALVERDFALLDAIYPGVFARVVSFHNPPVAVLRRTFDGFYSTYQPKFFGEIKYLSDSNRRWREGPPEVWLRPAQTPRLSILLHPVIWAYGGRTMPEAMRGFLETSRERQRAMLIRDDIWV